MSERLAKGVTRFRRGYFRRNRERYAELVREGQTPHALFITCADSRVQPHAMTGTDPGELFVLRNVGNMVPPWAPTSECAAVGSAIEYAVQVLGVADIVVCGHSHCGACAALYADEQDDMQLTAKWLRQGDRVRELVIEKTGLDDEGLRSALRSRERRAQLLRATERAMVVQHLSNLMIHPRVRGDRALRPRPAGLSALAAPPGRTAGTAGALSGHRHHNDRSPRNGTEPNGESHEKPVRLAFHEQRVRRAGGGRRSAAAVHRLRRRLGRPPDGRHRFRRRRRVPRRRLRLVPLPGLRTLGGLHHRRPGPARCAWGA